MDVRKEFFPFTGKHTLNIYPALKASRNEDKARYPKSEKTVLVFGLEELKSKLGLTGKYNNFKNFRIRVLDPIVDELKEKGAVLNVSYKPLKSGKKVTAIAFSIFDVIAVDNDLVATPTNPKKALPDYIPSDAAINLLSRSKLHAYEMLVDFGVKEGIVFRQMLPKITGGVVDGYEDIFVKYALQHFKKWARQQKSKSQSAGTFVAWWTKGEVFSHKQDVFWVLNEKLSNYIKKQDKEAKINREDAKGIPNSEFVKQYKSQESK